MGRVQDRDLGYRKIMRQLSELGSKSVVAGVLADAGKEKDGTDLVDVAFWNEFGTRYIPPRPFVRIAADKSDNDIKQMQDALLTKIVAGQSTASQALNLIGVKIEGEIKKVIGDRGALAANAPGTVRAKGSDAPLIDTGRLRQSVKYRIE